MLKTFSMIFIIISLVFWAAGCHVKQGQRIFAALSFAALCALAWLGVDFSPSMSLMFLEAGMICLSLGLVVLGDGKGSRIQLMVGKVLSGAGFVCMIPAVYMYASGEDHLNFCIFAALFLGILAGAAAAWRGNLSAGDGVYFGLTFATALFTIFCGIFSTMLLFAGVGLLCLVPVKGRKDPAFLSNGFLSWIGLFAIACFSVMPGWL